MLILHCSDHCSVPPPPPPPPPGGLITGNADHHLQGKEGLLLYGGEFYDGAKPPHDKTYVYGDIYHYDVSKDLWRKIVSPKGCDPLLEKVRL